MSTLKEDLLPCRRSELEIIAPGRSSAVGVLRLTRIFASEDADSLRMTRLVFFGNAKCSLTDPNDTRHPFAPPYFAGDEEEAEGCPALA